MKSSLVFGHVMHQRVRPVVHRFVYPIFMLRLNLREINEQAFVAKNWNRFLFGINRLRILSFYFKDYGPRDGSDLLVWIQTLVKPHVNHEIDEVELQTFPRIFGFAFNPISLWYCYDQQHNLRAILAEVNNTFGDHHFYLLRDAAQEKIDQYTLLTSQKMMHVSPFFEVKGEYRFQFRENAETCRVKIDYYIEDSLQINTAISGKKLSLTNRSMLSALRKQFFLTIGVVVKIHWHALLLWRKKVPFFRQPKGYRHSVSLNQTTSHEEI